MTPDVLIVGAGSAGCVVAERLSRDPARSVTVLERGPGEAAVEPLNRLPIDSPDRAVTIGERRGRPVVRGRGLGGSSAINGGYWLRGDERDYGDWPWDHRDIEASFDEVERLMRVRPFEELGEVARAAEAWARGRARRVSSNAVGGVRWTTGHLLNGLDRPNLTVVADAEVARLVMVGTRVTGVVTARGAEYAAGEVILCAGTLGTAPLVAPIVGPMPLHEHAERIVRFAPRRRLTSNALLQTVIPTSSGLEIRPYSDDFAAFTSSPPSGVPIGVADMRGTAGSWVEGVIDLGEPDAESMNRIDDGVATVTEMLGSPEFAEIVEPGSVRVDPVVGMSQHAWGTMPAGVAVDPGGHVYGTEGLRVIDGSILPGPLSCGPHATIIAIASLIAGRDTRQLP
ncbi:dehydrogenase [Gordonia spumicola]|uniref:Dehydrogenase n=1 Tax=Gordonia spumicola TaxID=589161 RepID=A0A7I9V4F2_9ACTN|nr:mycofactocin system GMC family oxidoreductase MftG [Gordonia spumicola]GED99880.1 dehydrogenase [Gordonia spumicola]